MAGSLLSPLGADLARTENAIAAGRDLLVSGIREFREIGELGLGDALTRILSELNADTGTIHRLCADGLLHLEEFAGGIPEQLLPVIRRIPVGKGMAGLAAERGEAVQICNLQTDSSGDARPGARSTRMQGSICVPMRHGGRLVGVLGVAVAREREFSADETAWLARVGTALASAFR